MFRKFVLAAAVLVASLFQSDAIIDCPSCIVVADAMALPQGALPCTPPNRVVYSYTETGQYVQIGCLNVSTGVFAPSGSTPAGSNTQIQFNNSGAVGANSGLTYNGLTTTPTVTIAGSNNTGPQLILGFGNGGGGSLQFGSTGPIISDTGGTSVAVSTLLTAATYGTASNCTSSASPAVCGSSASGSVVVAAASTTVQVNTTAVTANSQIQLTFDSSLGTKLSVTCNTTAVQPTVSARTGGTSFTITLPSAPTTNPACFSYTVIN